MRTNDDLEEKQNQDQHIDGSRASTGYVGWAIVAAVLVVIAAGLASQGLSLGGGENAVSDSGGSEVVNALKFMCPLH